VNSALWVGAVTGLAGAVVGGLISYVVSRQQIKDARAQRLEQDRADQARRSQERRFDTYSRFLTRARRCRNAARPPHRPGSGLRVPAQEIDALARSAGAASSRVFLVAESAQTEEACTAVLRTIDRTVSAIHEHEQDPDEVLWESLNEQWSQVLRNFQTATRIELGVDRTDQGSAGSNTSQQAKP
jgi:hypothetical protein